MREVKSETIFKTKSMSSIFKKMLFTEIGNANKDIFTPFMFAAAQASFDKFLWLRSETENGNFSFWYILMTSNVKIRLKSAPNSKSDRHWFASSGFVSVTWLKINSDHFCF